VAGASIASGPELTAAPGQILSGLRLPLQPCWSYPAKPARGPGGPLPVLCGRGRAGMAFIHPACASTSLETRSCLSYRAIRAIRFIQTENRLWVNLPL